MFADTLLHRRVARVEQPRLEWRERSVDWEEMAANLLMLLYRNLRSEQIPRLLSQKEYRLH
jgi:hypothetical protein